MESKDLMKKGEEEDARRVKETRGVKERQSAKQDQRTAVRATTRCRSVLCAMQDTSWAKKRKKDSAWHVDSEHTAKVD